MEDKSENKTTPNGIETDDAPSKEGMDRREFISKYGKYAAITPVAMSAMMHSKRVVAMDSDGGPS